MNDAVKNISPEVSDSLISAIEKINEYSATEDGMSAFVNFFQEASLDPLLKKENLSAGDLSALQVFSENLLNYSLESTIVILAGMARGGNDSTHNDGQEPLPYFGHERDFAVHSLAKQALAYASMFNSIALRLNWKLESKLKAEKEGGAQ